MVKSTEGNSQGKSLHTLTAKGALRIRSSEEAVGAHSILEYTLVKHHLAAHDVSLSIVARGTSTADIISGIMKRGSNVVGVVDGDRDIHMRQEQRLESARIVATFWPVRLVQPEIVAKGAAGCDDVHFSRATDMKTGRLLGRQNRRQGQPVNHRVQYQSPRTARVQKRLQSLKRPVGNGVFAMLHHYAHKMSAKRLSHAGEAGDKPTHTIRICRDGQPRQDGRQGRTLSTHGLQE